MKNKLLLLFLISILSLQNVAAVGIVYGYFSDGNPIDFQPNMETTFDYFLSTDAGRAMDYEISVEGDLAPYVTLSTTLIEDVPSGKNVPFSATLKLPEKLLPGLPQAIICALETETRGGGMVGARAKICGGVTIRVLYGEKYIKINQFIVPNVAIGEQLKIKIAIKSWSEVDINSIKAAIDILKPVAKGKTEKIATVTTEEKQLKANADETLTAVFDTTGLEAGEYSAFVKLSYDGKELNDSKNFKIGTLNIKILNYTTEFEQGKINRLGIQLLSQWNSRIDNIYGEVAIGDEKLTTPLANLEPWENKTLVAYWDTTDKELGDYPGKITIYYENKTTEQDAQFKVVISKEKMKKIITNVLVGSVIAILIIILLILIIKTRKPEKRKK